MRNWKWVRVVIPGLALLAVAAALVLAACSEGSRNMYVAQRNYMPLAQPGEEIWVVPTEPGEGRWYNGKGGGADGGTGVTGSLLLSEKDSRQTKNATEHLIPYPVPGSPLLAARQTDGTLRRKHFTAIIARKPL